MFTSANGVNKITESRLAMRANEYLVEFQANHRAVVLPAAAPSVPEIKKSAAQNLTAQV